jgi:hypothetical protein
LCQGCAENKATFISGGVQQDRARKITGLVGGSEGAITAKGTQTDGALYTGPSFNAWRINGSPDDKAVVLHFDSGIVTPTGADNAGTNQSERIWRRTS